MHTQWNDKFIDIIDKKLLINDTRSNIESNRYSRDEWIKRIQEHLNSI